MFRFGADDYPEHWPEDRWTADARLMREAGFNTIRLAEFAWSKMEPQEGRFDFDWLDRAIDIFWKSHFKVILGTPTASAPPWLLHRHPEIFRVRQDGQRVTYGNRRGYCPNNPLYRQHTERILAQMADHFNGHPALLGWQIDNEFGERCYCPQCRQTFHAWLRRKYASLDELNQKWGTIFWSHIYSDWAEIPQPVASGGSPNPSLALDYDRFMSDSYVDFQQCQVDLLRQKSPGSLLTHNFMGFDYDQINYFDLARNLDLVSLNHYPRSQWNMRAEVEPADFALSLDAMRGLKHKNFWMMEPLAGPGGWEMISVQPRPGELRLWAYQAIAHGADGILFFRWRSCRYGTEQFWHGLLDHDGTPSRRYAEARRLGGELHLLAGKIAGSQVKASVALLLSYDSRFAYQIQPNNPQFSYPAHFQQLYQAFYRRHVPIEIVSPDDDLSGYRLVVAPSLHLLDRAAAQRLQEYGRRGGTLVVTQRSGVKDETNLVVDQRLPGYLRHLMGVEVEEYDSLAPGMSNTVHFTLPELEDQPDFSCGVLCDVLVLRSARALALYGGEYYAGKAAISENRFGEGRAFYIGTVGEDKLYQTLAGWLLNRLEIEPSPASEEREIEIGERWIDGQRILFLLNFASQPRAVDLPHDFIQLIDGRVIPAGKLSLPPYGVMVLSEI